MQIWAPPNLKKFPSFFEAPKKDRSKTDVYVKIFVFSANVAPPLFLGPGRQAHENSRLEPKSVKKGAPLEIIYIILWILEKEDVRCLPA